LRKQAWRALANLYLRRAARRLGLLGSAVSDNLIVSLTTFPARAGQLHFVIQSLLNQTLQPRKIVLYLSLCEFPDRIIPLPLARLAKGRFEIRYVHENLGPYNKLIFALEDFPGAWIATCDDDRIYPPHWLTALWKAALLRPRTIICTRGRRIISEDSQFRPYHEWPHEQSFGPSFWLLPLGSWGTLYPPDSLNPIVVDRHLISQLAPRQDDLWFKVMSLTRDVPCIAIGSDDAMPELQFYDSTDLWQLNQSKNDAVWSRILCHYSLGANSFSARENSLLGCVPR
jgi:hypothetical protein